MENAILELEKVNAGENITLLDTAVSTTKTGLGKTKKDLENLLLESNIIPPSKDGGFYP